MKKALFTLFFGVSALFAFAQEPAIYSQYQALPVLVNPGYTGFDGKHQLIANARSSWTGFPGRPNTYTLLYNGPVGDKLALGGGLFAEKIGDLSTVKMQLNYAFRFQFQKAKIGLGLTTDFVRRQLDPDLQNDQTIDLNDDAIESLIDGQSLFDASVGAHVLFDDRFFVDLTLPNTIRTRLDEVPVSGAEEDNGRLFEHYIFQFGYIVNVPSQNFKFIPSLAVRKIRDTPYQIDLNVQGRFLDEKLIAGLTFRPSYGGTAAFLIGTSYNRFQLFYSYDVAFSRFQQYNGGSHEISFSFALPGKKAVAPGDTDLYK